MVDRRLACLLALLPLFTWGCAQGPDPVEPAGPTTRPAAAAPGTLFWFLLKPRLDLARSQGLVLPGEKDVALLEETRKVVSERLRLAGVGQHQVKIQGDLLKVSLADCPSPRQADLVRLATLRPRIELRLLVTRALAGFDLDGESERLWAWVKKGAHLETLQRDPMRINEYNSLAPKAGGPRLAGELTWVPLLPACPYGGETLALPLPLPDARRPLRLKRHRYVPICPSAGAFSHLDMDPLGFRRVRDSQGRPALGFLIKRSRREAFGRFTQRHLGMHLAVLLDGRLLHAPLLKTRLREGGVISWCGAGMAEERMDDLVASLRAPSLRVPLEALGR